MSAPEFVPDGVTVHVDKRPATATVATFEVGKAGRVQVVDLAGLDPVPTLLVFDRPVPVRFIEVVS